MCGHIIPAGMHACVPLPHTLVDSMLCKIVTNYAIIDFCTMTSSKIKGTPVAYTK